MTHPRPITTRQLKKLHAHYRGIDRTDRLQAISILVSRRVHSSLDLSSDEASLVIDRNERDNEVATWWPSRK